MENHYKLSDQDFMEQFKNTTLPPKYFSHEAHLRLAWLHIKAFGVERAITNMCSQIKAYANSLGMTTKYNETVTVAAVKAVYHYMLNSSAKTFEAFIAESSELNTSFKYLISKHYSFDIFNSESARNTFLEPDLIPFD